MEVLLKVIVIITILIVKIKMGSKLLIKMLIIIMTKKKFNKNKINTKNL